MDQQPSKPPDPIQREQALFAAALERAPEERATFLDGACHDDPELRQRLETLLVANDDPDSLLPEDLTADATQESPFHDEAVGQTLGRYKLLERVGEGGYGVVYVAEQTEPVRRRVALKVIKLGMDTKQVVARFEAERQALALMDHPNIAKVLDAGTTDQGRPYFVMELVRGIKITDYCDQEKMPTKERLELFIKVCHAIQHAHQKGIIHRDIKPSNILVTLHDGVPIPKVIDFGIAKATEGRLTDATVYTQLHQFIGTPAYMSPEQAEMSGLDIDTRSDIYSLGVLLYELLIGKTPFDGKELVSMGIDAMRKTIRESEPARPSTRFATLAGEELTSAAKSRSAEASKLTHLLRGDLDWIVMKCLEKDRQRRYETANGLASDIHRHLNNEPVIARPPSSLYKFQKAWKRNKVVFTATCAVVLALMAGLGTSVYQWRQTKKATLGSDRVAQFMIDLLERTIPPMRANGNLRQATHLMKQAEELAGPLLSNTPAAEIKLRWKLKLYYDEFLNDWESSRRQLDNIENLLQTVDDKDLPRKRMEIEVEINSYALWAGETETEQEQGKQLIREYIKKADELPIDLAGEAPSNARGNLGGWQVLSGDAASAEQMLREGINLIPKDERSVPFYFLRYCYFVALSDLGKDKEAINIALQTLRPPTDTSSVVRAQFGYAIKHASYVFNKLGRTSVLAAKLKELEAAVIEKNPADESIPMLRSFRGLNLLRSGAEQRGSQLLYQTTEDYPSNIDAWLLAIKVAAGLGRTERFEELKRHGMREFLFGAERYHAVDLAWLLLLYSPSHEDLEYCRDLVQRLSDSFSERNEWVAVRFPVTKAFLELRSGEYDKALEELNKRAPVRENMVIVSRYLKEDTQADLLLVKSLIHAQKAEMKKAETALIEGRKAMKNWSDQFTPGNSLMLQALEKEATEAIYGPANSIR